MRSPVDLTDELVKARECPASAEDGLVKTKPMVAASYLDISIGSASYRQELSKYD